MRYVGLDYGLARTGIAYAEHEHACVLPIATLTLASFATRKAFLDALAARIRDLGAECCVMGLPLPLDGPETLICRQIRNAAKRLRHRVAIPIEFMNEALSSEEAWGQLREIGLPRAKRTAVLDQAAACRILESYLAARTGDVSR